MRIVPVKQRGSTSTAGYLVKPRVGGSGGLLFIEEFQACPVALRKSYRLLTEPVLPGGLTVNGSSG